MFTIGPSDTVGFMVNVSNNEINIKKAKQFIGNDKKHAYVQPLDSLGVFESGMNNFLDGFKFS